MTEPGKDFDTLSRLIQDALNAAMQLGETTTVYLLSMASLEVSEKMEAANLAAPTAPCDDIQ
jgi:hypothetical protein